MPWVLSGHETATTNSVSAQPPPITPSSLTDLVDSPASETTRPVYNRYYHMFDPGELRAVVCAAAEDLGISIRARPGVDETTESPFSPESPGDGITRYLDIVQDDWERSNFYVELRLWQE